MARNDNWRYLSKEGPSTFNNDTTTPDFTVPDYEEWHILSLWIEYTATDSAATRALRIEIRDDTDDVMMEFAPGVTVTASQTRFFNFYPGAADLTAARDTDLITSPLPAGLVMRPGWDLSVVEQSSGDTSDSEVMLIQMMYAQNKIASTSGETMPASDS